MSAVRCLSVLLLTVLLSLQLTVALNTQQLEQLWSTYKLKYNKVYTETEDQYRFATFVENVNTIQLHNLQADLGQHNNRLAVNHFADWTNVEYRKMLMFRPKPTSNSVSSEFQHIDVTDLPASVDWQKKGAVTPVKNQGSCFSCYAFSATGALEGQHFMKTKNLVSLSEQQIIDCGNGKAGLHACEGAEFIEGSFDYLKSSAGIDTEDAYPYEAALGQCRFNATAVGATCTGFKDVTPQTKAGDELALQAAVANIGPISVGIDASQDSFQFYSSGVYDEPKCDFANIDHAVLVVGYGTTDDGVDYWLVKNSWSTDWGDNGYIKMSRNKKNQCCIASYGCYPTM